ncbi:unnamed protein product, partial [Didymodactylos carnosus]
MKMIEPTNSLGDVNVTETTDTRKLAEGIENAAVVCCFMTPDYQISEICKIELQYAQKRHQRIIPCMLTDIKLWKPSDWLEWITRELVYIDFHDVSQSNIHSKVRELIDRIKEHPPASQYLRSPAVDERSYLLELIKYEYKRNSRIEYIMNSAKSFSIEQSYINLAIVGTTELNVKEKKLRGTHHIDVIMGTFEEIYGTKTPVDVKDIFEKCKDPTKKVFVLGRAGIGKSTFCRYVTYRWAKSEIWSEYELVVLIPLRILTKDRYPPLPLGTEYSPIDLVKREYFSYHALTEKEERFFREKLDKTRVLWLLDGYDEIVQHIPAHLEYLLEQLLKTTHHILTSRPFCNTLFYPVHMEITGFTDENIPKYVKQFFSQIGSTLHGSQTEYHNLLSFLQLNPSIWGIAHIPVNLELICSLWSNQDWSETKTWTITALYDKMIEWLCRRYLIKQKEIPIEKVKLMRKRQVYENCKNELAFLERVAFKGMESNAIILRPALLDEAENETNVLLEDYPHLLNIGILKSIGHGPIGHQIEIDKCHYFIHLSFQEHFAARHLVNTLTNDKHESAIDFIKKQKYNQRFTLVFKFASGLLTKCKCPPPINTFWDTILCEPRDLDDDAHIRNGACKALGKMCEKAATSEVINRLVVALGDEDSNVRSSACEALGKMGDKTATSEVLKRLVIALGDENLSVRRS